MTTETRSSGSDSPERPQNDAGLRLPTHIVIMAATVAGLATVWTMVEIVLFVEPFALVGLPRYMRWAGGISLVLALLLFGLTWWLRRQPGLDRVVNGIQVLPHPSILRWVALASGAIMLLIGVAKDDIREQDVAQKQLAERGIDFTFDAFQNVLYLLNFGASTCSSRPASSRTGCSPRWGAQPSSTTSSRWSTS